MAKLDVVRRTVKRHPVIEVGRSPKYARGGLVEVEARLLLWKRFHGIGLIKRMSELQPSPYSTCTRFSGFEWKNITRVSFSSRITICASSVTKSACVQILCPIPVTISSKLFPPRLWIGSASIGWGVCSVLMVCCGRTATVY